MKKYLVALLLFLAGLTARPVSAQNVSIRVHSGGEPLGYAYIFVNGAYRSAADSTGTGYIPASGLQAGDTTGRSRTIESSLFLAWSVGREAATLRSLFDSTRGMIVKYRGKEAGRHVFLIIKPVFERAGTPDGFQTLLYVDEASRLIVSTETLMQRGNMTWRQKPDYLPYRHHGETLHPVRMDGTIESLDPNGRTASTRFFIDQITVHDYSRPSIPRRDRGRVGNIHIREDDPKN